MKEYIFYLLDTISNDISIAVFFGIGIGTVLGTVIILFIICVTGLKKRFSEQKARKQHQLQLFSEKAIRQYKQLLDDGAITQEEYECLKRRIIAPLHIKK